jgi:hypothetical protein
MNRSIADAAGICPRSGVGRIIKLAAVKAKQADGRAKRFMIPIEL